MVGLRGLALLSLLLPVMAASMAASASGSVGVVVFSFDKPGDRGWPVSVSVLGVNCSGVVGVNPGYLQARAVSDGLLVAPLYYVLASACGPGELAEALSRLDGFHGVLRVIIRAPEGFIVRSGLDWRGFGGLGGPYVVNSSLFRRFYLYDGVVLADSSRYSVADYEELGVSIVYPRTGFQYASVVAETVSGVRRVVTGWLGDSPRSPVVAVYAAPREYPLLAPGTAYSLGGVFLVVLPLAERDAGWFIHVAAHESVHGWINDGLVYGDFSFSEAVVELLAVRALYQASPQLYRCARSFIGEAVDAGEPYAVWLKAHLLLWRLALDNCGYDAYTQAIADIFKEAAEEKRIRVYSIIDVLSRLRLLCGEQGDYVLAMWGRLLPQVPRLNVTATLSPEARLFKGKAMGPHAFPEKAPSTSTCTVVYSTTTRTKTTTVTVTATSSAGTRVSEGKSGTRGFSAAAREAGAGLYGERTASRCVLALIPLFFVSLIICLIIAIKRRR